LIFKLQIGTPVTLVLEPITPFFVFFSGRFLS